MTLLGVLGVFGLVACGDDSNSIATDTTAASTTDAGSEGSSSGHTTTLDAASEDETGNGEDGSELLVPLARLLDPVIPMISGDLSYHAAVYEVIDEDSDVNALGLLIADNLYVTNDLIAPSGLTRLESDDHEAAANEHIVPLLVPNAVVVELEWNWGPESITTYAIVAPNADESGDPAEFFDSVVSMHVVPPVASTVTDEDAWKYDYHNLYGINVVHIEAKVECNDGIQCTREYFQESEFLFDAHITGTSSDELCKASGKCVLEFEWAAGRGFPDFEVSANDNTIKVTGLAGKIGSGSTNLTCDCPECTPS